MNVHRLTSWSVWVVPIAAVALIVGCEVLRSAPTPDPVTPPAPQSDPATQPAPPPDPVTPPAPGEKLVGAGRDATFEDVIGAVGILAPAILGSWGGTALAVWRLVRKHRAAVGAIRKAQPSIDDLTNEEREELGKNMSKATKRLIRQARGKALNIPL